MNYTFTKRALVAAGATFLISATSMKAGVITVPNSSFESPVVGAPNYYNGTTANGDNTTVSGWTADFSSAVTDYSIGIINNAHYLQYSALPDGSSQFAYENSRYGAVSMYNSDIGTDFVVGTTYHLSVDLGGNIGTPHNGLYTISLLDGSSVISTSVEGGSIPQGTFKQVTLDYTAVDTNAIGIRLTFLTNTLGTNQQGNFDDVQLTTGSVPEPSTYAMLAGGLIALGLGLRRRSAV